MSEHLRRLRARDSACTEWAVDRCCQPARLRAWTAVNSAPFVHQTCTCEQNAVYRISIRRNINSLYGRSLFAWPCRRGGEQCTVNSERFTVGQWTYACMWKTTLHVSHIHWYTQHCAKTVIRLSSVFSDYVHNMLLSFIYLENVRHNNYVNKISPVVSPSYKQTIHMGVCISDVQRFLVNVDSTL